jgi:hypothetical protein
MLYFTTDPAVLNFYLATAFSVHPRFVPGQRH